MGLWTILFGVYFTAAVLYWLAMSWAAARTAFGIPALSAMHPAEPGAWPKLSVIVAACNEADRMEGAARTLLAQDYPDLEIILVDDRSTDATGGIVDRLAAEDERVRAVHVRELPAGWLGKVNALNLGVAQATGEFFLFTDADVHLAQGLLRMAVAHGEAAGLDHLTAFPRLWPTALFLDATLAMSLRCLMLVARPWGLSNPRSKAVLGVGAFNMVRRAAFEQTEGFAWLRLEVGDDVGLAWMMKRSGARCAIVTAFDFIGLHWYKTVHEAMRGAEKAWASAFRCSLLRAVGSALVLVAMETAPVVCLLPLLFGGRTWVHLVGVLPASLYLFATVVSTHTARMRVAAGLLSPLAVFLSAWLAIRTGILGWRRRGIQWRGTFYRDKELLEGRRIPIL